MGGLSSLTFVVAADAYRQRPRLRRAYALVLLPVAIYFVFLPVALGPAIVFALGHLLIAGGMAAAAGAHLLLLRQARLLGATIVGAALLALAGLNVWVRGVSSHPRSTAVNPALVALNVVVLIVAPRL